MAKFVTEEGLRKIKEELENRKTAIRQSIANAIKEAKEQGDLSENAEYSEAKRQQAENEARVTELEFLLKESTVVKRDESSQVVQMGSRVKVKFSAKGGSASGGNGSEMEFQIVGSNEADPAEMKISNESPMGKAFMGRQKDDKVEVATPGGKVKYAILDVK
ncbi:MAG: transcription elongation factor GreA [Patescibacteria group bacterium]|nr:transcription elongation factor GreA [Patescibacteria group bacterium]